MLNSLFLQRSFFKFPSFINVHCSASAFLGENECKYVLVISHHDPQLSCCNDISKLGSTSQLAVHFNVLSL